MSSTSSPEKDIINAVVSRLESVCDQVLLGYSASGIEQDLKPPSLLVQPEFLFEEERQGSRAKYRLQLNVSAVVATNDRTTYALLDLARSVRDAIYQPSILSELTRKVTFSETHFDIAPHHGHLSFADMTLSVEAIF